MSNLVCPVFLIVFAPLRIGDEIYIQDPASPVGVRGRVRDILLMFCTLLASGVAGKESLLRIPNIVLFPKSIRSRESRHSQTIRHYMASDRDDSHACKP